MPFVNVKVTRDGVTKEKKEQLVREITAVIERVLGKNPKNVHIVIDEVDADNWGFDGLLVTEHRKKKA